MIVASGLASLSASAFDFEADGLCYNIISGEENKAEVTFKASGNGNAKYASGDITIPATVEHDSKTYDVVAIGNQAFQACAELTSVKIPESVTAIGELAFRDCSLLTTVNLPASLEKISKSLFHNCYALNSIDIPATVTVIGQYAFENCKSLTTMQIPDSVTTIESCAFELCANLESITIGESVETIGWYAFSGCSSLKTISIPASATSINESNAFNNCNSLQEFVVAAGNPSYSSFGGLLYNKDADTLFLCPKGIKGNVEILGSVTTISDKAFSSCNGIDALYCLSSTPASVGNSTFDQYQYTHMSLYVPEGSIEAYKNADIWSKFSVMEEFINVGVESVDYSSAKTELGRYDLWGARADKGHKGVVVIVYSDGTRAKRYSNGF